MIDRALSFLATRLNENLRTTFGVAEDLAVAQSPVGPDGGVPADARNRLILFLVCLAQDNMARGMKPRSPVTEGRFAVKQAPVHLSADFIMAACFEAANYLEALKILSSGIRFFQANPTFNPVNSPDLDPGIDHLSLEIGNMGSDEASQTWGMFGGRYLPSIRYRMRTITIDANALAAEDMAIIDPNSGILPAGSRP